MDIKTIIVSSFLLVLLTLVDQGNALKCYWCNSKEDKHCDVIKNGTHLINCDDKVDILKPPNGHYSLCRKMVITLPTSERRTIRSCGWEDHPKYDCYFTTARDVKSAVCECFTDDCNSATSITSALTLMFCPLLVTLLRR